MNKNKNQEGFTLLEVMIAMVVLVVGILGVAASVISSINLQQYTRELSLAMAAARKQLSNIEVYCIANGPMYTWNEYRAAPSRFFNASYDETDDPMAATDITRVPLSPAPDSQGVMNTSVGWVDFPLETGMNPNDTNVVRRGMPLQYPGSGSIDETLAIPHLPGFMPQDIDGSPDNLNTSVNPANLEWLPVSITIRWKSRMGIMEWKLYSGIRKK